MEDVIFLYSTAPDEETANKIALSLVECGGAACVNIIPGMTSIYRWKGKVEHATEHALIVKTTAGASNAATKIIKDLHPFEAPAISAIEISAALSSAEFFDWLRKSVNFSS